MEWQPCYIKTYNGKKLEQKRDQALKILESCTLCPHRCKVNRLKRENGICKTGRLAEVASLGPHFGEENCLRGQMGSGTVFFYHCNLICKFCQNWDISQGEGGNETVPEELAKIMLYLSGLGCHNINLVTPTHVVPQILEALMLAIEGGLSIPLVYNTGGYDSVETLRILDGVIDIYMPDFKFSDQEIAAKITSAPDYPSVVKEAIKEMHRQVGDLVFDKRGIARRGILLRHLVMPEDWAGTGEVMRFICEEISKDTFVNIMAQYHPNIEVRETPPLNRRITKKEYEDAYRIAQMSGIKRFDVKIFI